MGGLAKELVDRGAGRPMLTLMTAGRSTITLHISELSLLLVGTRVRSPQEGCLRSSLAIDASAQQA